ncbi:MAG: plastocyanin/azurin family copper-binding protein [Vicinamibacteria bacterium]
MKSSKSSVPTLVLAFASALSLASCGGSGYSSPTSPSAPGPTPAPVAAADVTVLIVGMAGNSSFSPALATVKVGQTVAWKNNDGITHAIAQDSGSFSTSSISPGATSTPLQMTTAGALSYHCSIHPSMTGGLSVTQ